MALKQSCNVTTQFISVVQQALAREEKKDYYFVSDKKAGKEDNFKSIFSTSNGPKKLQEAKTIKMILLIKRCYYVFLLAGFISIDPDDPPWPYSSLLLFMSLFSLACVQWLVFFFFCCCRRFLFFLFLSSREFSKSSTPLIIRWFATLGLYRAAGVGRRVLFFRVAG